MVALYNTVIGFLRYLNSFGSSGLWKLNTIVKPRQEALND